MVRYTFTNSAKLMPYIQGQLGYRSIYTKAKVRDRSISYTDDEGDLQSRIIESDKKLKDIVFSGGLGAGIHIPFKDSGWGLDLNVTYLLGSNAKYLVSEDVENWELRNGSENPKNLGFEFTPNESQTNMILYNFGVVFLPFTNPVEQKIKETKAEKKDVVLLLIS
jgi:hypothetical protein